VIGQTVKHYRVEESLGQGGMGVVYRARDTRLDRPVALKFLPAEFTADPDRKRRFFQEARAASAVTHPAIAQVYDVDEAEQGTFIVMEMVEGKTVRSLVKARELDLMGALEIASQVAGGLAKAHEAGIVHRDIKADNIMVTPDGHAKILDFGLAKLMDPPVEKASPTPDEVSAMETVARTQMGMVMGTLRYMSPEQARGQGVDHRSDIFSLGVVLYEMVTGQMPFQGATAVDTLHAIAFEETRPVSALRANLPPGLQRVITRCLRKRREDRYAEAKDLVGDLKAVQREVESGISTAVPLGVRLREQLASLADLLPGSYLPWLVLALLVALGVLFFQRSSEGTVPGLLTFAFFGLLVWRRVRNRRYRLLRKFTKKAAKLPEVALIAAAGTKVTVVADKALAKTYVRANALIDQINASMFWGEPFQLAVRDDLTSEERRALLTGPGVVYVREDALDDEARGASA
jgi:serine/threonine protein kinase